MAPDNNKHRMLPLKAGFCILIAGVVLFTEEQAAALDLGMLSAVPDVRGQIYEQTWSGHDYQGAPQNWDMLQDDDGFIYIANSSGVLIYDGSDWNLVELNRQRPARSLTFGDDGRIYVSGLNEIGYLEPDSLGRPEYHSLMHLVPDNIAINNVWDVYSIDGGVIFNANDFLLQWDFQTLTIWESGENANFGRLFTFDGRPLINHPELGLLTVEDDRLALVIESDQPAGRLSLLVQLSDATAFAGHQESGFYHLHVKKHSEQEMGGPDPANHTDDSPATEDDKNGSVNVIPFAPEKIGTARWTFEAEPLDTGLDTHLSRIRLYGALRTDDGMIAINTINAGIIIISPEGTILDQLTEDDGLRTNLIIGLGTDREGGLWALANNGITRFEYGRPLRYWDNELGLEGATLSLARKQDTLFVGTSQGLFYMIQAVTGRGDASQIPPSNDNVLVRRNRLKKVEAAEEGQTWDLMTVEQVIGTPADGLLIAGPEDSLSLLVNGRKKAIAGSGSGQRIYSLYASKRHSNTLFAGADNGIFAITIDPEAYRRSDFDNAFRVTALPLERADIRFMAEDRHGYLWLGNRFEDIIRVDIRTDPHADQPQIRRFHTTEYPAVSEREHFMGHMPDGSWALSSGIGLFHLSETYDRYHEADSIPPNIFELVPGVRELFPEDDQQVFRHQDARDGSGDLWLYRPGGLVLLEQDDPGGEEPGAWNLDDIILPQRLFIGLYSMLADTDGKIWMGGDESLIMLDRSLPDRYGVGFRSAVRSVHDRDGNVIRTYSALGQRFSEQDNLQSLDLPYEKNSLRLTYAAPTFVYSGTVFFQVWMEGFDEDWSDVHELNFREYTNLPAGEYVFRVRAINRNGLVGEEGQLHITIHPPWYLSRVAYVIYALGLALAIYLLLYWRTWYLRRKNRQLEKLVSDRTIELRDEKGKLEFANQTMSRFMSVVAHDLRNPVGVIMGYCDLLKSESNDPESVLEYSSFIQSAGGRIMRLLEDLVNFKRISSNELEVNYEKVNLSELCEAIIRDFRVLSRTKSQTLEADVPPNCYLECDKSSLRSIIENLLANAIKYTQRGGRISLCIRRFSGDGEMLIEISDNGQGFSDEDKKKAFGEFQRLSSQPTGGEGSSGLGLFIVKNLVAYHQGTIQLQTEKGKGSTFTIRLPLTMPANTGSDSSVANESFFTGRR
ncbi:ATP-binding protein [Balneolales bacterium ANBcel1]|nr:ATP-binding protein [Balneolales bacterium ANBcel1]